MSAGQSVFRFAPSPNGFLHLGHAYSALMNASEACALRLDMDLALAEAKRPLVWRRFDAEFREEDVQAEPARWGDVVIARKEVPTSYHLAVTLDDAIQGVTHAVRGTDLEAATDV